MRSLRSGWWKPPCHSHLACPLPPCPPVTSCPRGLLALLRFLPQLKFLADQPTRGAGMGHCTGHFGSSWSLWSTRKCLCGRTSMLGWKYCANRAAGLFWCRTGAPSPTKTNVLAAEGHTLLTHLKDSPWVLDQFFTSLLASWHLTSNKSGIWGSGQSHMHPRGDADRTSLFFFEHL